MARERGSSNLRQFNEEREQKYCLALKLSLEKTRKRKIRFSTLGNLAEYVSSNTGIHRTTLTRNPKYRMQLLAHLGAQKGGVEFVSDDDSSPDMLRAKLVASRLEVSNLKQTVKRLKRLLGAEKSVVTAGSANDKQTGSSNGQDDIHLKFVDTAMLLVMVLERVKDSISVNFSARSIDDLAARPSERMIAGPARAKAFIEWFEENRSILFDSNNQQSRIEVRGYMKKK